MYKINTGCNFYYKEEKDIDCHLYCDLRNCTKIWRPGVNAINICKPIICKKLLHFIL